MKHGPNRNKPRGPQKGLPNSARDLLPMLQPATKALAQVLAGRAGASGQLGHARTMLAQAERMIAERAHNRLTPAEREEFFEQLARLKLTLADADAEAEVQAVEQHEPRPQAAPVAQERLKEMALALSVRERPPQAEAAVSETDQAGSPEAAARAVAGPVEPSPAASESSQEAAREPEVGRTGDASPAGRRDRLVLPRASADQAVQALAIGGLARRRSRAQSWAAAASAADAAERLASNPAPAADEAESAPRAARPPSDAYDRSGEQAGERRGAESAGEPNGGHGGSAEAEAEPAKAPRRTRRSKRQGLPEGWVIDEEGFVVPGAG